MFYITDPDVITERDVDNRPHDADLIGVDVVCEDCDGVHDVVFMVRLQSDGAWICDWCDARREDDHADWLRAARYDYA